MKSNNRCVMNKLIVVVILFAGITLGAEAATFSVEGGATAALTSTKNEAGDPFATEGGFPVTLGAAVRWGVGPVQVGAEAHLGGEQSLGVFLRHDFGALGVQLGAGAMEQRVEVRHLDSATAKALSDTKAMANATLSYQTGKNHALFLRYAVSGWSDAAVSTYRAAGYTAEGAVIYEVAGSSSFEYRTRLLTFGYRRDF